MIDLASYGVFLAAAFLLLVTPGPAVLYIVSRSLHQGRSAGVASSFGLSAGMLVQVGAAVLGLSAVVATSATAYNVVRWIGGGYLIWLGLRTIFSRSERQPDGAAGSGERPLGRVFVDGVVVNVFNPKLALFLLAFLPQFADPSLGSLPRQIAFLGVSVVALGLITDLGYAFAAGWVRGWLGSRRRPFAAGRNIVGATYLGLGLVAAFGDRRAG